MTVYITKKVIQNEYNIISVSDDLVEDFELENREIILVKGNSIQDVLIQFAAAEKEPNMPFNPTLQKVREK
jgi:hypothetical protein